MTVKLLLAVPTLNRMDRLTTMLTSVANSTRQPDRVLIVNNGHQVTDGLRADWSRQFDLDVYTPHVNLGVAGSVNFAWRNTPSDWFWCHCNDDTEIDAACLGLMADSAEANQDAFIVPESGIGLAFTLFMIQSKMRDRIGYFDEVFNPSYHEDNSFGRRMNIAGVRRVVAKGAYYIHHTSSTLKAYTEAETRQHHENFRRNALEYERMWGGSPDRETFNVPYNGRFGHTAGNLAEWGVHVAPREDDALW